MRGVARAGQLAGRLEQAVEHGLEVEVADQRRRPSSREQAAHRTGSRLIPMASIVSSGPTGDLSPDAPARGSADGIVVEHDDRPRATIVLADDHAVVRPGLRLLLEAEDGLEVVAEAGDVARRLALTPRAPARCSCSTSTCPAARASRRSARCAAAPRPRRRADDAGRPRLRPRGDAGRRHGYVLKEAADDELVAAVRAAADGETYLNPALGARSPRPARPAGRPTT